MNVKNPGKGCFAVRKAWVAKFALYQHTCSNNPDFDKENQYSWSVDLCTDTINCHYADEAS